MPHGFKDRNGRVRATLTLVAAATLTLATAGGAQEGPVLLGVDARLADYGLASLDGVALGRIAHVHDPSGDRIALHFLRAGSATVPTPVGPPPAPELADGTDREPEIRALWVWSTARILADDMERATFLEFVEEREIGRVFLYVPSTEDEVPSAGYLPFDGEALAPLLADLHERGTRAYALDGDPDYVRPENHAGVLRTVRRVVDHNRSHPPEERFYGVRYDIEPYLLAGFHGPARARILGDYVRLLGAITEVAHEAGLRVGADIPFWLDSGDEVSGEPFEAEIDGELVPTLDRIMSTVDDVGIMAYRTTVDGANGVVPLAANEVSLGSRGGADVFVGVETTRIFDEDLYTLRGRGRAGLPSLPDARWVVGEPVGDDRVRLWLVEGQDALDELARRTGDARTLRYWFAGQPVPVPGDLISFHSRGAGAMWSMAGELERRFGGQPGFLGLAFHDYLGLRELLAR